MDEPTESDPQLVKLRNGSEEPKPLVNIVLFSLERLFKEQPIHFYELVQLCRDGCHALFGKTEDDLLALGLVQRSVAGSFAVHDSIRNVVLSAVNGEGLELSLESPVITETDDG